MTFLLGLLSGLVLAATVMLFFFRKGPFQEGLVDRLAHRLTWGEQLYRYPFWKRILWRGGWIVGHVFGNEPLRTERKP